MSGIDNLDEFLSKEEQFPKLYKWFDAGFEQEQKKAGYAHKKEQSDNLNFKLSKSISIWPFAGYGRSKNRNPNEKWWTQLIDKFIKEKINFYHFGYFNLRKKI